MRPARWMLHGCGGAPAHQPELAAVGVEDALAGLVEIIFKASGGLLLLAADGWGRLGTAGDGWGRLGTAGDAGDRWGSLGTAGNRGVT